MSEGQQTWAADEVPHIGRTAQRHHRIVAHPCQVKAERGLPTAVVAPGAKAAWSVGAATRRLHGARSVTHSARLSHRAGRPYSRSVTALDTGDPTAASATATGATPTRLPEINAYDDELARPDAVAVIDAFDRGELSPTEYATAAVQRARRVGHLLGAVAFDRYDEALAHLDDRRARRGSFEGLPTFIKDMVAVAGLPLTWGSDALAGGPPQRQTLGVARDMERMGFAILGTSTMPEWGFIPSTEYPDRDPARNPWNPTRSIGGSSGGSAALVAAGVVPIAHAVDGGGSTRIPAACGGLVGLKPSLGRLRRHSDEAMLPVSISVDGVVTRSVRDTARWYAEMERVFRPRSMRPMGEVTGPPSRRLRIGMLGAIPGVATLDAANEATLADTAAALEALGHHVEPTSAPFDPEQFRDDFVDYYRFLVFAATRTARLGHGSHYRRDRLTRFSEGMAASFRAAPHHIVGAARRLRRTRAQVAEMCRTFDLLLTPTLSTVPPELGYISTAVDFEPLLERVVAWMTFTPLANAAGTPSISLPMGFDADAGVPVGAMLSADFGEDALLLQVAFELEAERPWALSGR